MSEVPVCQLTNILFIYDLSAVKID